MKSHDFHLLYLSSLPPRSKWTLQKKKKKAASTLKLTDRRRRSSFAILCGHAVFCLLEPPLCFKRQSQPAKPHWSDFWAKSRVKIWGGHLIALRSRIVITSAHYFDSALWARVWPLTNDTRSAFNEDLTEGWSSLKKCAWGLLTSVDFSFDWAGNILFNIGAFFLLFSHTQDYTIWNFLSS